MSVFSCAHRFRCTCSCFPTPKDITRAAESYFFDYDDSFKVEEDSSKDPMDRWAEREQWMRVKPR